MSGTNGDPRVSARTLPRAAKRLQACCTGSPIMNAMTARTFRIATAGAPWGPVRVAVTDRGLVGLAVGSPIEPFTADVARRTGLESDRGGSRLLDRAVAAVEAFLDGRPGELEALPIDLVVR